MVFFRSQFGLLTVCLMLVSAASILRADTFVLQSGGRIEGRLVNSNEMPRRSYIVETASGAKITLSKAQVKQVIRKSTKQKQYEELLPKMPDTAEGNWKMAEWCRTNGLAELRELHLRKVIEHEPNHALARKGLGYGRTEDGDWINNEEWMKEQGYVYYKGSWKTQQEIQVLTQREQVEGAQDKWTKSLGIWRRWIGTRRETEAREKFLEIKDPLASKGVADLLAKERDSNVRMMFIRVLGNIESSPATTALIRSALEDDIEALRDACITELKKRGGASTVLAFISALKSSDNRRVNRAASALGQIGNPTAILPLMDALETEHKYVTKGSGGAISPTFGSGPGGGLGGLGIGGGGPKIVNNKVRNEQVLFALVALTDGQNFLYDEQRWKQWYAQQQRPTRFNLRRD